MQIQAQKKQAEQAAEQAAKVANERAALQEQLAIASSQAAAARHQVLNLLPLSDHLYMYPRNASMDRPQAGLASVRDVSLQVAQLQQAAAKAAAHTEALQAEHGSLQAALRAAQNDLQAQHDCTVTSQVDAHRAAAEQEAYVQMVWPTSTVQTWSAMSTKRPDCEPSSRVLRSSAMQTTEVISTLSSTTRQLEADLLAEQIARRRAEGDAAARDRAAQDSGAALKAICSELRTVQVRERCCSCIFPNNRLQALNPTSQTSRPAPTRTQHMAQ
jgi:hypothetical protein